MDLFLKLGTLERLKDLKIGQWLDRDRIEQLQARRLEKILRSAQSVDHYRFSLGSPADLESFPLISKADIQRDSFGTRGRDELLAGQRSFRPRLIEPAQLVIARLILRIDRTTGP